MKIVEKLASATKELKIGNHRVLHLMNKETMKLVGKKGFQYFGTTICLVDDIEMKFVISAIYKSQHTTRVCNAYRKYYMSIGYTEIED